MASLFPPDLPPGFRYDDAFLTAGEEAALIHAIGDVTFSAFEMRGVVARRRVAFFGQAYDATRPAEPMPDFLRPLRQRAADWAGIDADALAMALINAYRPARRSGGTATRPSTDIVIGVSLGSPCRMRLRPYVGAGRARRRWRAAHRHARARAGTTFHLPDLWTGQERVRAQHSGGARTSVLNHVPIAASRTVAAAAVWLRPIEFSSSPL